MSEKIEPINELRGALAKERLHPSERADLLRRVENRLDLIPTKPTSELLLTIMNPSALRVDLGDPARGGHLLAFKCVLDAVLAELDHRIPVPQ